MMVETRRSSSSPGDADSPSIDPERNGHKAREMLVAPQVMFVAVVRPVSNSVVAKPDGLKTRVVIVWRCRLDLGAL
jgi:hypothetical protein